MACYLRPSAKYVAMLLLAYFPFAQLLMAADWAEHVIDNTSTGADGVKLGDFDGNGLLDVVTGWEEGGVVRAYRNPGAASSESQWPKVTVGVATSAEDAVFVDLDGDGAQDVVSCCEGSVRTIYVHWCPLNPAERLDPTKWTTQAIPASVGIMRWMYCQPLQVDGNLGIDLVVGGKETGAAVGWWESPANPRNLAAWTWHPISSAGWIMSLITEDMDGDGDQDGNEAPAQCARHSP